MDMPLFSIVIPIYKTEEYLPRCVDSARNQTYSNIEIVLVDDGSPDACPTMCDEFAKMDGRIQVIHKENGGLSDARNMGIDRASGKYILLLDSDDYLEPDACERLVPAANTDCDTISAKWILNTLPLTDREEDTLRLLSGADFLKASLASGHMSMAAVLYLHRREFLNEHGLRFKKGIRHEDDHFTPRALLKAKVVAQTNVAFYRYILREDSITTQKDMRRNGDDLRDTCAELRVIYDGLADRILADRLTDLLAVQQLSLSQQGKLYQYGRDYVYRRQIMGNARRGKTIAKALLYCLSPRLYWHINYISKLR